MKRKIVFNKMDSFIKGEKQEIVLQELAKKRTNDSELKMQSIIDKWKFEFGVITARNILRVTKSSPLNLKISYKTICKYYKYFKIEIEIKNDELFETPTNQMMLCQMIA